MNKKQIKLPKMQRTMQAVARALPAEEGSTASRVFELPVSSEQPVMRIGGPAAAWYEVLAHTPEAIDMSRVDGMPLLLEHNLLDQVGAVNSLMLADARLNAQVRFSSSQRASEIEADVADGIRRNVSIGYIVSEYEAAGTAEDGLPVFKATRWMPYEVSYVAVGADPTVGMGRAAATDEEVTVTVVEKEDDKAADASTTEAEKPAEQAAEQAAPAAESAEPAAKQADEQQAASDTAADPAAVAESTAETADEKKFAEQRAEADSTSESAASKKAESTAKDSQVTVTEDNTRAAAEIVQLATAAGMAERAAEFLQSGFTVEQARRAILENSRSKPLIHATNNMTDKDLKNYSYARAILVAAGEATGGLEAERHQEFLRNLPTGYASKGGIFVPMSTRGMDSKTAGAGADTVFKEAGELIDLLRAQAVVVQMGARMYPGLNGPVGFPKITSGTEAHWGDENPDTDVAESQLGTGSVNLNPRTLQATTAYSRQLLQQSVLNIEAAVRNDISAAHALAIDRAALHGVGGLEPLGIYNTPGVNIVDMKGEVPTHGRITTMIAKVLAGNALLGQTGFVASPLLAGQLAQTLTAQAAGAGFIWNGKLDDGVVAGYRAMASNQVRSDLGAAHDEHGFIFGNFADLLIGTWGAMELTVDPYALKKRGMIEVTSYQLADVAIRNGASFTKATNIKFDAE